MLFNKRRHLFEFGDQPWNCGWFREIYNDALNMGQKAGGHYRRMAPYFARWAASARAETILDLASGGAAPLVAMLEGAAQANLSMPRIICSDLFPDTVRLKGLRDRYGADKFDFITTPVSALDSHPELPPARSICTALHHFPAEMAARIIKTAVHEGSGLFVLEPFQRNTRHFMMMLLTGPWIYMVAPFFAEHFSFRKLLFCTLFPIVPLMIWWDGLISVLRMHTPEEIEQMIPEALRHQIEIESGFCTYLFGCRATYISLNIKDKTPFPSDDSFLQSEQRCTADQ